MKDEVPQRAYTRTPIIRSRHLIVFLTVIFIFVTVASFSTLTLLVVLSESLTSVSASVYLNNMDHDIDACSDFYSFTCGKYAKNHAIPQHATKISVLYEMKQNLDNHLRNILENSAHENSTKSLRLAQTYYDSCMNDDAQNELVGKRRCKHSKLLVEDWDVYL
ncbi:unnamed protein product [Angiostrongylus costaricensis]|uniref:Peptidase_M13_N domain-containing protein n=1 Tax=Angiostrongylus costaricensis TaxID=334426 RepID=A0A0R3PQP8_ANGCS|nr:unnamed protein product [Angiostrongylus costaricensis]